GHAALRATRVADGAADPDPARPGIHHVHRRSAALTGGAAPEHLELVDGTAHGALAGAAARRAGDCRGTAQLCAALAKPGARLLRPRRAARGLPVPRRLLGLAAVGVRSGDEARRGRHAGRYAEPAANERRHGPSGDDAAGERGPEWPAAADIAGGR